MPGRVVFAEVSQTPLSVDRAIAATTDPRAGGIALFVGVVRDHDQGNQVDALTYSSHPTVNDALAACADQVAQTFDVEAVAVSHRVGELVVGDLAVVVAVSAAHRGPALAACAQLIDDVKREVPIWKEQQWTSGGSSWVGV